MNKYKVRINLSDIARDARHMLSKLRQALIRPIRKFKSFLPLGDATLIYI